MSPPMPPPLIRKGADPPSARAMSQPRCPPTGAGQPGLRRVRTIKPEIAKAKSIAGQTKTRRRCRRRVSLRRIEGGRQPSRIRLFRDLAADLAALVGRGVDVDVPLA